MSNDLVLILDAASFAADKHRMQRRKDPESSPYINHPLVGPVAIAKTMGLGRASVYRALAA